MPTHPPNLIDLLFYLTLYQVPTGASAPTDLFTWINWVTGLSGTGVIVLVFVLLLQGKLRTGREWTDRETQFTKVWVEREAQFKVQLLDVTEYRDRLLEITLQTLDVARKATTTAEGVVTEVTTKKPTRGVRGQPK
jgi:hypothetical protein